MFNDVDVGTFSANLAPPFHLHKLGAWHAQYQERVLVSYRASEMTIILIDLQLIGSSIAEPPP